jgi:opacity protein-like surface antigen
LRNKSGPLPCLPGDFLALWPARYRRVRQGGDADHLDRRLRHRQPRHHKIGWVWGLGVEGALWANWTAKFEYLQMDLGHVSDSFSGITPFTPVATDVHLHTNFVRMAVTAKFN